MNPSKLTVTALGMSLLLASAFFSCKKNDQLTVQEIKNDVKSTVNEQKLSFKLVGLLKKSTTGNIVSAQSTMSGGNIRTRVYLILQDHGTGNVWEVPTSASLRDDLDGDELTIIEIFQDVEEEFGIEIPDEDAETIITVGDLISYVELKTTDTGGGTSEPPIDWGPDLVFGAGSSQVTTIDEETSGASFRNKFVNTVIFTAGPTVKFRTYEKIVLVKNIPVIAKWMFDSIEHLSMTAEGTFVNVTIEPIVNFTNGSVYNDVANHYYGSYARMQYSVKDKRTTVKNGQTITKISADITGFNTWTLSQLGISPTE